MAVYDAIIAGGGVIGLSIARELRKKGVAKIAVLDRGQIGREASWAAGGMLAANAENEAVDDFYRACSDSARLFPNFAAELLAETGIDIELDTSGTLFAAFTEEDVEHITGRHKRQIAAGINSEYLNAAETLSAEPNISGQVHASLFFPDDWQVENRKTVAALIKYAETNCIGLLQKTDVLSVIVENGNAKGVITRSGPIYSDIVILATGAWTSFIKIGTLECPVKVKPIKGQMALFEPHEKLFTRVIYSPRGYLVPRSDGRILAGATVEDVGFDKDVTKNGVYALSEMAAEIAPALSGTMPTDSWAGFRPYGNNGIPVVGALPGFKDLFVATAHYRNGILLAPLTAKLVAAAILEGKIPEHLRSFAPA